MVHDRPYKLALTHEEALEELQGNAGTQFDPQVVDVFCSIYAQAVPPDGLEEVYRLHQRARGGLSHLEVDDGIAAPPPRRTRRPPPRPQEASG
jgi:hypothetical protein